MYMVANSAHSVPSKLWEAMHSVSEACKLWEPGMQVLGARHAIGGIPWVHLFFIRLDFPQNRQPCSHWLHLLVEWTSDGFLFTFAIDHIRKKFHVLLRGAQYRLKAFVWIRKGDFNNGVEGACSGAPTINACDVPL